ncbi:hypothetical protein Cni_G00653 [Canna indica]|uniref:EF-hand domain-containing protein n=1 Tax=Canna indica TaxID=4628 RepID=A0AAQ3JLQ0_9LILI|nr:hypothetical protein Cni_G00653 [Canna indica]
MKNATCASSSSSSSSSVAAASAKKEHVAAWSSLITWFCCVVSPAPKKSPKQAATAAAAIEPPFPAAASCRSNELHRVFCHFDENGDGKISATELRSCMRAMGEEVSQEDAVAVVESTDSDGDGLLGYDDFVKLVDGEGEQEKERNLMEAFRVYEEGEGCITPKSLRSALGRMGETKSVEECRIMIRQYDINGDGVISFDEFRIMMV